MSIERDDYPMPWYVFLCAALIAWPVMAALKLRDCLQHMDWKGYSADPVIGWRDQL